MSRIAYLQEKVRAASEAVARAEQAASRHPQYPSAFVSIRSAEKLRNKFTDELGRELLSQNINACSYRIEYEGTSPAISGITKAIGLFQEILTNVYHAIRTRTDAWRRRCQRRERRKAQPEQWMTPPNPEPSSKRRAR